ncbi:TPA: DUF4400 domain-containing protein, partial [Neisseria gonorrhoeae]
MPSNTSAWYMNSLPLKFLFLPFKAAYTLFLIVLLIFGSSVLTQNYFGTGNLLEDEIKWSESVGHDAFPGKEVDDTINLQIARLSYKGLKTVFFDLTLVNESLKAKSEADFGYKFKNYLVPRMKYLQQFDTTLKVISLRLGNLALIVGISVIFAIPVLIDGLVMRAIRQENASRESAGIYHRAKYWRTGIIWLGCMIYMCVPISIPAYLLYLPLVAAIWMIFM